MCGWGAVGGDTQCKMEWVFRLSFEVPIVVLKFYDDKTSRIRWIKNSVNKAVLITLLSHSSVESLVANTYKNTTPGSINLEGPVV